MNNLLQSLSSHRLKLCAPDTELKLLLSAVKEGRNHDAKLSDAFYDSLEGVLHDLRAVTIDNRDADAFLKPVSKVDYPDYYDIIPIPMDLQTMLKKVKQKQYKSKREFADDLELIWSNCFIYNTGDAHPLRICATRLRAKAIRLLKNVTDRRDRMDPPVPTNMSARGLPSKPNGIAINGHSRQHSSPPPAKSKTRSPPVIKQVTPVPAKPPAREVPFTDMPAFVRTAAGMSTFMQLDGQVDAGDPGPSTLAFRGYGRTPVPSLSDRLLNLVGVEQESDEEDWGMEVVNGDVGEKRKLLSNGNQRPRKRARLRSREQRANETSDPVELWWEATRSSSLMANAVPTLKYSTSQIHHIPSASLPPEPLTKKKWKQKKKRKERPEQARPSLLGLINNNIRTLKRVRKTHDKFLALNLTSEEGSGATQLEAQEPVMEEEEIDVQVDERPWPSRGTGHQVSEQDADECLQWMGTKILEHAGFQGTSQAALDVFTGVAAEYLMNVGRTIRFLCDKYSRTMTAEEIILHTLFESGITHVQELERYIKDDIERYGGRLMELEKKLVGAYREVTAVEALDDDALFKFEDDEEDGELVMGNFADAFGEDFLGLRELGIAADYGLSSLSIPKKLLRGKNKGGVNSTQDSDKPKEPPPPYPPPPPFVPLNSTDLDDQIGLLRPFYMQKLNAIAPNAAPVAAQSTLGPPSPLSRPFAPPPSLPASLKLPWELPIAPKPPAAAPPIILPDDPPNPTRTKIGPLGQIIKPGASAAAAKKKGKGKEVPPSQVTINHGPEADRKHIIPATPVDIAAVGAEVTKKKKTGGKKKEKTNGTDALIPPVIVASA